MGVFKAYCTRVGSGPFPTEQNNDYGESLRRRGSEFGATTGRPRRCGWLDLPMLKYAIMINGTTQLMMTKADVLSHFDTIKVCTAYRINNKVTDQVPFDVNIPIEPVYIEMKSWKADLTGIRKSTDLPAELMDYVRFIEKNTGIPVRIIGVGAGREQFIQRA
jgi:adenylosuccinate synthase